MLVQGPRVWVFLLLLVETCSPLGEGAHRQTVSLLGKKTPKSWLMSTGLSNRNERLDVNVNVLHSSQPVSRIRLSVTEIVFPTLKTHSRRSAKNCLSLCSQQDSQEFLIYLLEGLHEDVNRVTEKRKPVVIKDEEGEEKIRWDSDHSLVLEQLSYLWKSITTVVVCVFESLTCVSLNICRRKKKTPLSMFEHKLQKLTCVEVILRKTVVLCEFLQRKERRCVQCENVCVVSLYLVH